MDLQNFSAEMLYFKEDSSPEVDLLLQMAAKNYGQESESLLLKALALSEKNVSVLVGLYRFYYFQHRYEDALEIARIVMQVVAEKIEFPASWHELDNSHVLVGVSHSFTFVRLYLFALKAAGYVCLRLNRFEEGKRMLEKVVEMDSKNRIGAELLLDVLQNNSAEVISLNNIPQLMEAKR